MSRTKGAKTHTPTAKTRKRAILLAGLGLTQEEIATVMEIATRTLTTHYTEELRLGAIKADTHVLENLYRMATGTGPEAGKAAIFWTKVKRRWHEVQRVIHGFDPAIINTFVNQVVSLLRRMIPDRCPHCKTNLDLMPRIGAQLQELSRALVATLPPSEIVAMPRPELASDDLPPNDG